MRTSPTLILASALAVVLTVVPEARQFTSTPAATAPAERTGWWMRPTPANQATHVFWRFGPDPVQLGAPMAWVQGTSPDALDVPADQRTLGTVHVATIGMPPSAPVSFCVFYGDRGVALVEFTQETTLALEQGQAAEQCVP